jgi:hypothetical protein
MLLGTYYFRAFAFNSFAFLLIPLLGTPFDSFAFLTLASARLPLASARVRAEGAEEAQAKGTGKVKGKRPR